MELKGNRACPRRRYSPMKTTPRFWGGNAHMPRERCKSIHERPETLNPDSSGLDERRIQRCSGTPSKASSKALTSGEPTALGTRRMGKAGATATSGKGDALLRRRIITSKYEICTHKVKRPRVHVTADRDKFLQKGKRYDYVYAKRENESS